LPYNLVAIIAIVGAETDMPSAFDVHHWLAAFGPWALAVLVGLEGMGVPLPGETALIAAALYASAHDINVAFIIAVAATGAIIGDNIGYLFGREFGFRLLKYLGPRIGITERRIKLGQYLFSKYGAIVAFFGRFVAVLRTAAPFLAGMNQFRWPIFLLADAAGAICWSAIVGGGAYLFGRQFSTLDPRLAILGGVVAVALIVAAIVYLRRNEERLSEEAERALPGPLREPGRLRHPSTLA
jgi:membrane protein DedA with SNARE-associated domain